MNLDSPEIAEARKPSLLDACTCARDGKPCAVCRLWDQHIAWLEARPEPSTNELEGSKE